MREISFFAEIFRIAYTQGAALGAEQGFKA